MREIKFRVWDKLLKQMFAWEECNEGQQILTDGFNGVDAIAMQYTGLKDTNGVEVYEGDIVRKRDYIVEVKFSTKDVGSCGCCYPVFLGSGFIALNVDIEDSEIIGNIYENPELLEQA